MNFDGHGCCTSDFHIQLDGESASPIPSSMVAQGSSTRDKRLRSCEVRFASVKNVTVAELDGGLAASSGMSSAPLGLAAECECRTGSSASTLPAALDNHERHVIVESATRPLRELSQCGLGKPFRGRALDV
jgi:hypothetical protein